MKSLNTKATLIIQKLYEAMSDPKYRQNEDGNYAKIHNNPNLMAVVVEKVGNLAGYGEIISIAHYGEQNGDLMADPEMTFTIVGGEYYPVSFRNDYVGIYQEVFNFNEDGEPEAINTKLQSDLIAFANTWMKSIQEQQKL
ncbi:MAG: hypothetical protein WC721_11615 [Victivallaceae bacterium]|jgi:hypothetical protein